MESAVRRGLADRHAGEPELGYLPARLWLMGLGHLGQAYMGTRSSLS
jgi:hypothetical protein